MGKYIYKGLRPVIIKERKEKSNENSKEQMKK